MMGCTLPLTSTRRTTERGSSSRLKCVISCFFPSSQSRKSSRVRSPTIVFVFLLRTMASTRTSEDSSVTVVSCDQTGCTTPKSTTQDAATFILQPGRILALLKRDTDCPMNAPDRQKEKLLPLFARRAPSSGFTPVIRHALRACVCSPYLRPRRAPRNTPTANPDPNANPSTRYGCRRM